jgi:AcrR family transcriptional regulator
LTAAQAVFAERGYDAAALSEIGARAGVARATPTYFFGTKRALYEAVLARVTTAREIALRDAFARLRCWAAADGTDVRLEQAIRAAVDGYLAFLDENPDFARLIAWEAQTDARRLSRGGADTRAVADALWAVHAVRRERRLADFDPALVSVAFVSMCFLPVAHHATFRAASGLDTAEPAFRQAYADVVTEAITAVVTGRASS